MLRDNMRNSKPKHRGTEKKLPRSKISM